MHGAPRRGFTIRSRRPPGAAAAATHKKTYEEE